MQGAARGWVAFAVVLGACATSDLSPEKPSTGRAQPATAAGARPPGSSAPAMQLSVRPTELSPEAQELLERLGPSLSRSSQGLRWVAGPKGTRSMDLQGRFAHATLAVRGADGVVRNVCVESPAGAESVARKAEGVAQ